MLRIFVVNLLQQYLLPFLQLFSIGFEGHLDPVYIIAHYLLHLSELSIFLLLLHVWLLFFWGFVVELREVDGLLNFSILEWFVVLDVLGYGGWHFIIRGKDVLLIIVLLAFCVHPL